ncbi:MAG: MATE family efflux transporter [Gemmatimonadetes bacterium]|nr:MATE family efflux transporter [Gemmatimonadota bacterium]
MSVRTFVPNWVDLRELWRLAMPVAVVQLATLLMGAVDTAMVGRVSAAHLGAVGLGNIYFFCVSLFGIGLLMGFDPVLSQAVGAEDQPAIARAVQRGLILSAVTAAVASVLHAVSEPVFTFLQQPDSIIPLAAGYAEGLIPGMFPFFAFMLIRLFLQAVGDVRPVVVVVLAANVANFVLNWMLIFGNWGAPELGAVGSAYGTSICRWIMLLGLCALIWRRLGPAILRPRRAALSLRALGRVMRVGVPVGLHFGLEYGVFAAAGLMVGLFGETAFAGHQITIQLASFTFMLPMGIAQATAVLVGRSVGARDPRGARRAAGAGLTAGGAAMAVCAAAFVLFPAPLARLFSPEVAVVSAAVALVPVAGFFQIVDGIQVVGAGALRGLADTTLPMLAVLVSFWVVGVPVSWAMGFPLGFGPVGIWWGLAAGLGVASVLLLVRLRIRFARPARRVVIDASDDQGPG